MVLMGKPNEDRTQHGENVSLDESNQQLQRIHEEQHDDAEGVESKAESYAHRPTEEDHASERQDHSMACHHVGKETDHQGERLREDTEELYDRHNRGGIGFQEQRHLRPENLLPMLMASIVHSARKKVILMLPVTLAPPGKMGIKPMRLHVRIKKNTVSR